jgi:F0F1-type ATP synthase assembly protein I
MEKDNNNMKKDSLLNSEYLQVFTKVSVWIVGPVIASLIIGKYLDNKYNSTPWILCVALALSFTLSMFMIVRIAKKYDKDTK